MMRLTPLDIRKQEFTKRVRGVDPDEVQAFLEMLATQWQEVDDDVRRLEEKLREAEQKLQHYQQVEMALQQALETARVSAKQAAEAAEQKAKAIIAEAEQRAEAIKRDAVEERVAIGRQAQQLAGRRNEAIAQLRAFLMSEMEVLARFDGSAGGGLLKLMPPTDTEADAPSGTVSEDNELTHREPAPSTPTEDEQDESAFGVRTPQQFGVLNELEQRFNGDAEAGDGMEIDLGGPREDEPLPRPGQPSPRRSGPGWKVHSLVSVPSGDGGLDDEPVRPAAPTDEMERVRQLLRDLD